MVHRSMRWPGSDSLNFAVSERFHRSSSAFTACTPVTEERVSHRIDAGQGAPWSTSLVQVGTGVLGTCHLPSCLRRAKRAGRQDSIGFHAAHRGVASAFDSRRHHQFSAPSASRLTQTALDGAAGFASALRSDHIDEWHQLKRNLFNCLRL